MVEISLEEDIYYSSIGSYNDSFLGSINNSDLPIIIESFVNEEWSGGWDSFLLW